MLRARSRVLQQHERNGIFTSKQARQEPRLGARGADEVCSRLADLLDALQRRMSDLASGVAIVAPDAHLVDRERVPLLTDTGGEFVRACGTRGGMVWLVRPDGHIGWRCDR